MGVLGHDESAALILLTARPTGRGLRLGGRSGCGQTLRECCCDPSPGTTPTRGSSRTPGCRAEGSAPEGAEGSRLPRAHAAASRQTRRHPPPLTAIHRHPRTTPSASQDNPRRPSCGHERATPAERATAQEHSVLPRSAPPAPPTTPTGRHNSPSGAPFIGKATHIAVRHLRVRLDVPRFWTLVRTWRPTRAGQPVLASALETRGPGRSKTNRTADS